MFALVLLILLSFHPSKGRVDQGLQHYCEDNTTCPTWFVCNAQSRCQCGSAVNDITTSSRFLLFWIATVLLMIMRVDQHMLVHASTTVKIITQEERMT